MLTPRQIRSNSLLNSRKLGCDVSSTLPLLNAEMTLRQVGSVQDRVLALNAVVAASYGYHRQKALVWVQDNVGVHALTDRELAFLASGVGDVTSFQKQVESLCAFAWALHLLNSLEFEKPCPNTLRTLFPDLKQAEASSSFRQSTSLRTQEEVLVQCDLAYCLHWCLTESLLQGQVNLRRLEPHVVIERRRALEWMLNDSGWDTFTLDT